MHKRLNEPNCFLDLIRSGWMLRLAFDIYIYIVVILFIFARLYGDYIITLLYINTSYKHYILLVKEAADPVTL